MPLGMLPGFSTGMETLFNFFCAVAVFLVGSFQLLLSLCSVHEQIKSLDRFQWTHNESSLKTKPLWLPCPASQPGNSEFKEGTASSWNLWIVLDKGVFDAVGRWGSKVPINHHQSQSRSLILGQQYVPIKMVLIKWSFSVMQLSSKKKSKVAMTDAHKNSLTPAGLRCFVYY